MLDNEIEVGNCYRGISNNQPPTDAELSVASAGPLSGAARNVLHGNARITVGGAAKDVLIEHNVIRDSDVGIDAGGADARWLGATTSTCCGRSSTWRAKQRCHRPTACSPHCRPCSLAAQRQPADGGPAERPGGPRPANPRFDRGGPGEHAAIGEKAAAARTRIIRRKSRRPCGASNLRRRWATTSAALGRRGRQRPGVAPRCRRSRACRLGCRWNSRRNRLARPEIERLPVCAGRGARHEYRY